MRILHMYIIVTNILLISIKRSRLRFFREDVIEIIFLFCARLKRTPNSEVWSKRWTRVVPMSCRATATKVTTMTSLSKKSFILSTEKRSNEKARLLLNKGNNKHPMDIRRTDKRRTDKTDKYRTDKRRMDKRRTDKSESNRWMKLVARLTSILSWSCRNGNSSFKEPGS